MPLPPLPRILAPRMVPRDFYPLSSAEPPFFVGIDLGGTNIKSGIIDNQGRILGYAHLKSEVERGPEAGAQRMAEAACNAAEQGGMTLSDMAHVGLVTPGTMDIASGMLLEPPNLPGWSNFPIRDRVSHYTDLPVAYANDANAAAYGEFWVGSGAAYSSMVMLTLGTGVGGGIITDGSLLDGANSHGGEIGHMIIDSAADARLCACGGRGHLEAYCSATALTARAIEAMQNLSKDDRSLLGPEEDLTPLVLYRAAEAGNAFAEQMILQTARFLGIGITTLLHILDPAAVVLGGAMNFGGTDSPIGKKFLTTVVHEIQTRALPVLSSNLSLHFASLGGDAGFIGAAGIGRLAYQKDERT